MATSDLLNMSNEIANVNISDPVEDSEAIKAPKGRLKRLQKKPVADDENESNNEQTLKMREAETASEAHSSANKSSGKKDSDKKRRLDDFASEMRAMQISEQIEEEKTEKKKKKKKEKKSVSKFLDEDLKKEDDDEEEPLIYDFGSEDEEDGNSGKDKMEEEDSATKKSKKDKKKRDKSEKREKRERRERREKSARRERSDEAEDTEYVEYTEGDEGGEAAERSERPTREKGALKKLSKKRDEDNLFGDILAKRKAKKEPKKTGEDLLQEMRQDRETYTMEDPDSRDGDDIEMTAKQALQALERTEKVRFTKQTRNGGTIKTRNKLFEDINLAEFINEDADDTPALFDTFIEEEIQIVKPDKKKDIGKLISTIEQYKTQKIRVPIQKSMSTIVSKPSQNSQASDLQVPTMEVLPHSNSTPAQPTLQTQESAISGLSGVSGMINANPTNSNPASLPTLSAVPSTMEKPELQRQGTGDSFSKEDSSLIRQKSVNLKSIISSSKVSIATDDDRLIEVQVSVPHLQKAPALQSQNLADNTLFINYLTKQQSFVNKNAIIGQWKQETKKKDLKTLAAELSQKHKMKKSGNLTTEIIQSRFQVTDLNELEEKLNKNKKENSAEKKESEEKDSDFNPDEPDKLGEEDDEFTFQGNPEEGDETKQNSASKGSKTKKTLDIDDIRRLEEGEGEGSEGEDFRGDDEAEEVDGEEEEEEVNNEEDQDEEEKVDESEEKIKLDKFDDMNVFNEVEEKDEEEDNEDEEEEGRQRRFKKLKTLGQKVLEKIKNKEKQRREREKRRLEERLRREEAMKEMGTYMEVEAELGSDNEGNDDFIKAINKNDEEENEEGLDDDLEELIDFAYNEDGDFNEGALNQYLKDLLHEDRENIKKVIQRSWNNKKRKRDQFEIDVDDEERTLKKMKRMEDIIKELEDDENKYFNVGEAGTNGNKNQENDNYFDEELALKKFELLKAEHQLKKSLHKRDSFETKPKDLLITEDDEIKKVVTMAPIYRKKTIEPAKVFGNNTENKAGLNLFKQRTITKGSILSAKDDPKNINLFNNKFNKDVLNEFGAKEGLFSSIEKKMTLTFDAGPQFNNNENSNSNPFTFGKTKDVKGSGAGSSLNKLFTLKSSELKGPSPNKMFIFNSRTKK